MKNFIVLLIYLVVSFEVFSQNIYIYGELKKTDEAKLQGLLDRLIEKNGSFNLYLNGEGKDVKFRYKKKSNFVKIKRYLNSTISDNKFYDEIINYHSSRSQKKLFVSYILDSDDLSTNGANKILFNNIARDYNIKNKKYTLIIFINPNRIKITKINIKNNEEIDTREFNLFGTLNSNIELSKIQLRLNNEEWLDLDFERISNTDFEFYTTITLNKINYNRIEIKAIDINGTGNDHPIIIERIKYKEITLNSTNCQFRSPDKNGNNVEKRIYAKRSDAIVFWFKIETVANLDGLQLVRCNRNKQIIATVPLKDKYVPSAENYYCFGLTREELKLGSSDCFFESKGLDMLSYIYIQDISNLSKGEMIPAVFSTIDANQEVRDQILKAQCEF
jgi:hypothetical protein